MNLIAVVTVLREDVFDWGTPNVVHALRARCHAAVVGDIFVSECFCLLGCRRSKPAVYSALMCCWVCLYSSFEIRAQELKNPGDQDPSS